MSLAALLLAVLGPTHPAGVQGGPGPGLLASEVSIEREADHLRVTASYRIEPGQGSTTFHAVRFRGQRLTLKDASGGPVAVEAGLYRIELSLAAPATVHLRYTLRGSTTRVPIFVPSAPALPGVTRLRIVLRDGAAIPVFPRFDLDPEGDRVAEPTHLPAFVALRRRGGPDVGRIAEWVVVILIVGGSLAWLARSRGPAPTRS